MYLAIIKLIEVLARAVFTVGVAYSLPLDDAGRFGIIVTMMGLASFMVGWERHIDIQRRMVGADDGEFDETVSSAIRMWLFNSAWVIPVFLFIIHIWTKVSLPILLCAGAIIISDIVSNFAYNIAVVSNRYRKLVIFVAARNVLLLLSIALIFIFSRASFSLNSIFAVWAILSLVSAIALASTWLSVRQRSEQTAQLSVLAQLGMSKTHFLSGALAVIAIQADRLVVGSILTLSDTGIYFRHILLVSFAYQFFNVFSYNRKLPIIFALVKDGYRQQSNSIIMSEYAKVTLFTVLAFLCAYALDAMTGNYFSQKFHFDFVLAAIMLFASLVRVLGDFMSLILNASHREKTIFLNQLTSFSIGACALVLLAILLQLHGAAAATVIGAVVYTVLNLLAVRKISPETRS